MSLLAVLTAAALVSGASVDVAAAPPGAGEVRITADRVSYDVSTGRVLLEGDARVVRGAVVLRARSATYDPETNEVRAAGGVLLTDAQRAIAADAIRAVLGGDMEAEGVLAFVKDQPADLSSIRDAEEARRAGRNRLTFSGARLRGNSAGRYRLDDARLTLCDCPGGGAPSWLVTAREADIIPGKRAILRWPVLRITPPAWSRPVPVLALPWLYVPLGDRQSGLLLPLVGSSAQAGFRIAQPLYLTLGRSADATLTPEYAFGRARDDVRAGKPAARGPGARLELRWAPAEAAEGRAELAWMNDLDSEPDGEGGHRWALALAHAQPLGARTDLRASLRLAGDPVWERDMNPDILRRAIPYQRSDVLLSHRREPVVLEGIASYLQPLRREGLPATPTYGPLGSDVGVASRWGSAGATFLPATLGPLRLSGRAGAARFGPATGDVDVVARPGATRADARAALELPLLVGGAVTVAPWLGGAALGYGFDGARDASAAAWGLVGATVGTEVSRSFGRLRHALAPRLEWRAGSRTVGDALSFPAYDALDRAEGGLLSASPGSFQQLRAAIATRLEGARATVARAEIGQDVDLVEGRFAETFASAAIAVGPLAADARARFFGIDGRGTPAPAVAIRSPLDDLTEFGAGVSLSSRRGDALRLGYFSVGPGGSGQLVAGLDPLFDVRALPIAPGAFASAGARAVLGPATVGYDAHFRGRASDVPLCSGVGGVRRAEAFAVQQHTGSLAWDSPCRCFRLAAVLRVNDCGEISWNASVDLARLTSGALSR